MLLWRRLEQGNVTTELLEHEEQAGLATTGSDDQEMMSSLLMHSNQCIAM